MLRLVILKDLRNRGDFLLISTITTIGKTVILVLI